MKNYIGTKCIKAEPCTRGEHSKSKGFDKVLEGTPEDEGYKVIYEDGYESWSPKDVFEETYRILNNMTYGLAIEALQQGKCVARKGWNGINMFICKQVPSEINADVIPKMQSLPQSAKDVLCKGEGNTRPIWYNNQMIIVNTKTRKIDSWVASSSDTFAEDWYIVE